MRNAQDSKREDLIHDLLIIAISVAGAIWLVRSGALASLLDSTGGFTFIGTFVAGMFFTSFVTTAPSIATFSQIMLTANIFETAAIGALGAVIGDLIIFRFVKKELSVHFLEVVNIQGPMKRLKKIMSLRLLRWLSFLVGGLIIASPLPDELGIGLLGFSKLKTSVFIAISFVFNFIGILVIGLIARAI